MGQEQLQLGKFILHPEKEGFFLKKISKNKITFAAVVINLKNGATYLACTSRISNDKQYLQMQFTDVIDFAALDN